MTREEQRRLLATALLTGLPVFMVEVNSGGSVFVKDLDYFTEQGGWQQDWGSQWVPIAAAEAWEARHKGCLLPGARPREEQAWW